MKRDKRNTDIKSMEQMILMSATAIEGTQADDWIAGTGGDNDIQAMGGNDEIYAPLGNNNIDGGEGNDILYVYEGKRSDYVLERLEDGRMRLQGIGLNNEVVTNTLKDVERISFQDGVVWIGDERPTVQEGSDHCDWLTGFEFTDLIQAFGGNDSIYAPEGVTEIDGGDGFDTLIVYEGNQADYEVTREPDGAIRIVGPGLNGGIVENTLRNIERVMFNDRSLDLSTVPELSVGFAPVPEETAAEQVTEQEPETPAELAEVGQTESNEDTVENATENVSEAPVSTESESPAGQESPSDLTPEAPQPQPEVEDEAPTVEQPLDDAPIDPAPPEEAPQEPAPADPTPVEPLPVSEPIPEQPSFEEPAENVEPPAPVEPEPEPAAEQDPEPEPVVEQTPPEAEAPVEEEQPVESIVVEPPVEPPVEPAHPFVQQVVDLTNAFRRSQGLGELTINLELQEAAQLHSESLAHDDFFSHTGIDGRMPWDRALDAGYNYYTIGENIAAGQLTPEEVVQAWIDSPSHLENLMNPAFTEIGIGYEYLAIDGGNLRNYNHYWTQLFGHELP